MKSRTRRLTLAGLLASATTLAAAQAHDCIIRPNQVVRVGVPTPGVIERIPVERGDVVRNGQVVAQLKAGVERAALAVAGARARQQAELDVAGSSQAYAQREFERANELHG